MALNFEELKIRLISGIVLFSSSIFIISLGGFFYISAIMVLALFCAAEFFTIINNTELTAENRNKWMYRGVLIIAIPAVSLYSIREIFANGIVTAFWFFILVVIVDTCAYFVGKMIGRTKLVPSISPSKTIEGFIGGVLLSVLFSMIFFFLFNSKLHFTVFAFMSLCIAILAQISDILESKFKRMFGVKDSSNLIPGHGGFLDRLDGYLLTSPALLLFYFAFKVIFGVSIF